MVQIHAPLSPLSSDLCIALEEPSLSTGGLTSDANATASIPGNSFSQIETKSYLFVGPKASGCYTPSANQVVWANYTWNVSWSSNAVDYCNQTGGLVTSTADLHAAANVHFGTAPYYVVSPSPQHSVLLHTTTASCTARGVRSSSVNGLTRPLFLLTVGPVSLNGGTSYDFTSSVWENQTVDITSPYVGDYGWSEVSASATLVSVVVST
jgi:hypothetical protein